MDELWSWSADRLASAIAAGAVTSVAATESALARMAAVDPQLNAVVDPTPDEAMAAARAADAAVKAGEPLGPLHGVPVTAKVNVDMKGRATTNGIVALKDNIAPGDSGVVANFRKAGAVIVGRTNTPAFSMRWFTENDLHGETLNPWDPATTCGGSSGGAGASLAAGIGAVAHGNDIGGSVRFPAYCNGTFGLRPSSGVIPSFNPSRKAEATMVAQMSAVQGPLTRWASDLWRAMQALSARDPRDHWWTPSPAFVRGSVPRACRVAVIDATDEVEVDASVRGAIDVAAGWLSDAGYDVVRVPTPSINEAKDAWRLLLGQEFMSGLWPGAKQMGDWRIQHAIERFMVGVPDLSKAEFIAAVADRNRLLREWMVFFEDCPLVLTSTSWKKPHPKGYDLRDDYSADVFYSEVAPLCMAPILGLPGLSCPTGVVDGLPTGVQLIAGRFDDNRLIQAGEVFDARLGAPLVPPGLPV